jgi:hypothetical protein
MAKEKNLGKLKSRFEARGGLVNEFDFHRNQEAIAEEERSRFARQSEEKAGKKSAAKEAAKPGKKAAKKSAGKGSVGKSGGKKSAAKKKSGGRGR